MQLCKRVAEKECWGIEDATIEDVRAWLKEFGYVPPVKYGSLSNTETSSAGHPPRLELPEDQ